MKHLAKLSCCTTALAGAMAALAALSISVATESGSGAAGEWRDYGGDKGFTKYSPLDQINKDNVGRLRIAWRRPAVAEELRAQNPKLTVANNLRSTPLMVGGVLYASNGIGLVEAFDPGTGKTIWVQEFDGELGGGAPTRGVAYWSSGAESRILSVRGQNLFATDPKTGKLIRSFGDNGHVDLRAGMGPLATSFFWTSSPQICRDAAIIGASMTDSPQNKEEPPGRVQAFDVRSGKPRWTFNPIPRPVKWESRRGRTTRGPTAARRTCGRC